MIRLDIVEGSVLSVESILNVSNSLVPNGGQGLATVKLWKCGWKSRLGMQSTIALLQNPTYLLGGIKGCARSPTVPVLDLLRGVFWWKNE